MAARGEFAAWIGSAAEAIVDMIGRLNLKPSVQLIETEHNVFVVKSTGRSGPPDHSFLLSGGEAAMRRLPDKWLDLVRGRRIEVTLRPDRFLWRPLELPKRAVEFLEPMVRSQIDRLTPWTAQDAVFGSTAPVEISADRIQTTVIAAPRTSIDPLIRLAESWRAACVVLIAAPQGPPHERAKPQATRLIEHHLRGPLDAGRVRRILTAALVVAALAATLSFGITSILGGRLEEQQRVLSQRVSERRATLRLGVEGADNSAFGALLRSKQERAASVLVLDALSRVLPDETYVTELRIDRNKLQITGISRDAPALIGLLEQSAHFNQATFSAPTTRAADDAGERFHIEVGLKAYFGGST
ncbi:putative General secretion pathway protein L [Bradyrhizobium sp. ORS 285]|uniref:PilN domain-containing protein n=1 Tax=Bradyrhizobium sp. ORS 285 TaxID=115808 RepID=UPI00024073BE|nr:PilN domain-containing protein [Bradyrhizobium sp. ORS 285]CCD89611.1 putative General secretion pathway protein L [Bradyrhizobium sp. ORS 285]SMX56290.1 putative General secretion pathway protein L [Bradyrhizobium sp. ORS 285]